MFVVPSTVDADESWGGKLPSQGNVYGLRLNVSHNPSLFRQDYGRKGHRGRFRLVTLSCASLTTSVLHKLTADAKSYCFGRHCAVPGSIRILTFSATCVTRYRYLRGLPRAEFCRRTCMYTIKRRSHVKLVDGYGSANLISGNLNITCVALEDFYGDCLTMIWHYTINKT